MTMPLSARDLAEPASMRAPTLRDAAAIAKLAGSLAVLDRYSPYLYVLLCDKFSHTCVVAEEAGELLGFVTGLRPPAQHDTLFVWQVGVAKRAHRRGIAGHMLRELFLRPENRDVRWLETTVASANTASRKLFQAFARSMHATIDERPGYSRSHFPDVHEDEPLLRIGPLERSPA